MKAINKCRVCWKCADPPKSWYVCKHRYTHTHTYNTQSYRSHVSRSNGRKPKEMKTKRHKDKDKAKERQWQWHWQRGTLQNWNSHFHNVVDCSSRGVGWGVTWQLYLTDTNCVWATYELFMPVHSTQSKSQFYFYFFPLFFWFLNEIAKGIDFHFSSASASASVSASTQLQLALWDVAPFRGTANDRRQSEIRVQHTLTHIYSHSLAQWACKFLAI